MADEPLPLSDAPQQGVFEMAGLAFHRNMLVSELAGHRDGLGEPFDGRVAFNHSRRHDRDIVATRRASMRSFFARAPAARASCRIFQSRHYWVRSPSYPFLADAGSCPGDCSGMEDRAGAPSSPAV